MKKHPKQSKTKQYKKQRFRLLSLYPGKSPCSFPFQRKRSTEKWRKQKCRRNPSHHEQLSPQPAWTFKCAYTPAAALLCGCRHPFPAGAVQSLQGHNSQAKNKWSQQLNEMLLGFALVLRGTFCLQILWAPFDEVRHVNAKLFSCFYCRFKSFIHTCFCKLKAFSLNIWNFPQIWSSVLARNHLLLEGKKAGGNSHIKVSSSYLQLYFTLPRHRQ